MKFYTGYPSRKILGAVLISFMVLLLWNCKKNQKQYNAFFYTDRSDTSSVLQLYIDEKKIGDLPNLSVINSPGNDTIRRLGLNVKLKSGKYKIEAKDPKGNMNFEGTFKFKASKTQFTSTMGGSDLASDGETIAIKLKK